MDNAGGVCSNQCGSDLRCDVEYCGQLQRLPHVLSQCDALDELSRNEDRIVLAANLMDCEYVWMIECRRCLRFLNEALDATLVSRDFAGEEFQSHRPAEFRIRADGFGASVEFTAPRENCSR
jgi:hypothetical protein